MIVDPTVFLWNGSFMHEGVIAVVISIEDVSDDEGYSKALYFYHNGTFGLGRENLTRLRELVFKYDKSWLLL